MNQSPHAPGSRDPQDPRHPLRPTPGVVSVVFASVAQARTALPDPGRVLAADELARSSQFRFPEHAEAFRLRRALLRTALGQITNTAPAELVFASTGPGRRWLPDHEALDFNASNAGDRIAIAISERLGQDEAAPAHELPATPPHAPPVGRGIGLDIEVQRAMSDVALVARTALTEGEFAAWQASTDGAKNPTGAGSGIGPTEAFLELWTRKEAVAKAHGLGIGGDGGPRSWPVPTILDASPAAARGHAPAHAHAHAHAPKIVARRCPDGAQRRPMTVASWSPDAGVLVSLAVPEAESVEPAANATCAWTVQYVSWLDMPVWRVNVTGASAD
ncbi:MAG: 4'-phosphopantetheinyl transferase superfamily protein [Phycisphaerales bacterium]